MKRWRDGPCNSPDEITTTNRLIKSEIASWWRTDALHAGGESETNSSVISQLLMRNCACSCNYWNVKQTRGSLRPWPTVMFPDRIPLGKAGTASHLRVILDLPSSLLWGSGASCCPITCQSSGTAASLLLWIMQQWCLQWRHIACRNTNKDVYPR